MIDHILTSWGQPIATWAEPGTELQWTGQTELPEGSYVIRGVTADVLRLPMRGRVVIADSKFRRLERFSNDPGDLELVVVNCSFTEQLAIHMPAALKAVAVVNCSFTTPNAVRNSYIYISAKGPNYIEDVKCSGGWSKDNGQHAVDLGTEDGELISVRGLETGGGSTSGLNFHVKRPRGLKEVWISESVLRDRTGIDCADVDNSRTTRTGAIKLYKVDFALTQHPTFPASMYCVFPANSIDEIHGLGGVTWTSGGSRAWPASTDPKYGGQRPKIIGVLPWNSEGERVTTPPVEPPPPPPPPPPPQPPPPAQDPEPEPKPEPDRMAEVLAKLDALHEKANALKTTLTQVLDAVTQPTAGKIADELAKRLKE